MSTLDIVVGAKKIEFDLPFEGMPLRELLAVLVEKYPKVSQLLTLGINDSIYDLAFILVNNQLADLDRGILDDDLISILPPLEGG